MVTIKLSKEMPTTYRTTRPKIPLSNDRAVIETRISDHLLLQLRRFEPTDLPYVHHLRTQEAVMVNTSTGVIDGDVTISQKWMDRFLPPKDVDTFNLMIWAKENDKPWEHIGSMGAHDMTPVPHIGYMLRTEWWGKSVATKAVQAFLTVWWNLERVEVEMNTADARDEHDLYLMGLELDQTCQSNSDGLEPKSDVKLVPEILLAEIEERNIASVKVIERCGFKYRDREKVLEDAGTFILLDYTMTKPLASEQA